MLIYLASYPRSGNTLVANVIAHYFRIPTSSAYRGEGRGHGEIQVGADGTIDAMFTEFVDGESGRTARALLDGMGAYLTDDLRETLAADDERFFLKTHESPFGSYFEGERVVHIVRHPGAASWSYWHYLAHEAGSAPTSLEEVIEGRPFPGSWSRHTQKWLRAAAGLGERYLRLRYEDVVEDEAPGIASLSRLTGLARGRESGTFPGFDFWHGVNPDFYRSGDAAEWLQHFTTTQKALLWALHGQVMAQLGYSLAIPAGTSGATKQEYLPGLAGQELLQDEVLEFLEGLRESVQRLQETSLGPSAAGSPSDDVGSAARKEMDSKQVAISRLQDEVANKQKGIDWLQHELAGKKRGVEWLQREVATKEAGIAWLERELTYEREVVQSLKAAFEQQTEAPTSERPDRLRSVLSRLWRKGRPRSSAGGAPSDRGTTISTAPEAHQVSPRAETTINATSVPSPITAVPTSPPPLAFPSDDTLRAAVQNYSFYHIIPLSEGVSTPGILKYLPIQQQVLDAMRGMPWEGRKVIDIGCRDGLFALEAEKLGAATVIGVDNELSRGAVELVLPLLHSRVAMYEGNLYDLRRETFGPFDVALFPGVLYHLRYPFWGLRVVRDLLVDGGLMILETALWRGQPDIAALWCPTESESPYESTSVTFFNEKGLRDTLESLGFVVLSFSVLPTGSEAVVKTKWGGITRACVVCRFLEGAQSPRLIGYWDGLHSEH